MKHYFSIFLLSLVSLNAHAAMHKWVDADGNMHYSDTRPNEDIDTQAVRNIAGKDQAGASPGFVPKSYVEKEAELKKSKQEKEDVTKKQAELDKQAEVKKSNCASARENARTFEESPRIATYDANGERAFMDDETRAQRLEEARKTISENCN